ncbi:MAG: hypothetical protein JWO31_988 [Phycisphaerales bacterium]|nr:hypothetical protein [Phycisphaerales bacterium]
MPDQPLPDIPQADLEPLVAAVGNAVIDLLPDDWDAAVLDVTAAADGGLAHAITHPRRARAWVAPSIELAARTADLLAPFRARGEPWTRARVEVDRTADGEWGYEVGFSFD